MYTCISIVKPEEPQNGLRRSRRNRCKPVAWYKGERIVYARRKSGKLHCSIGRNLNDNGHNVEIATYDFFDRFTSIE